MNDKGKGVLSYLLGWLGGLIVLFYFKDNNRKTVTHACQAITMSVAEIILSFGIGFISGITYAAVGVNFSFLSSIVSLLYFILMIMGIVKVVNDEDPKLPVVGDLTMKFFEKRIMEAPEFSTGAARSGNFDPITGKPVNPTPQGNFDPVTGKPVNQAPQGNFDPMTGEPINRPTPQGNFDPMTGEPIKKEEQAPMMTNQSAPQEDPFVDSNAVEEKPEIVTTEPTDPTETSDQNNII